MKGLKENHFLQVREVHRLDLTESRFLRVKAASKGINKLHVNRLIQH